MVLLRQILVTSPEILDEKGSLEQKKENRFVFFVMLLVHSTFCFHLVEK
jgi:hypothetical protein